LFKTEYSVYSPGEAAGCPADRSPVLSRLVGQDPDTAGWGGGTVTAMRGMYGIFIPATDIGHVADNL
jgi:hypothetical protein